MIVPAFCKVLLTVGQGLLTPIFPHLLMVTENIFLGHKDPQASEMWYGSRWVNVMMEARVNFGATRLARLTLAFPEGEALHRVLTRSISTAFTCRVRLSFKGLQHSFDRSFGKLFEEDLLHGASLT